MSQTTMTLVTLKRRSEFLRIRGGARWSTPSLLLEGKMRVLEGKMRVPVADATQHDANPARFGFTVTKKLGTAVVRNRIRRRLREIVRQGAGKLGLIGCDYVIVARDAALRRPSQALRGDLETALAQVNRRLKSAPASRR
jgi:ribonuclease P protein component